MWWGVLDGLLHNCPPLSLPQAAQFPGLDSKTYLGCGILRGKGEHVSNTLNYFSDWQSPPCYVGTTRMGYWELCGSSGHMRFGGKTHGT